MGTFGGPLFLVDEDKVLHRPSIFRRPRVGCTGGHRKEGGPESPDRKRCGAMFRVGSPSYLDFPDLLLRTGTLTPHG